jgi:AhpC/TSA family
MLGLTRAPNYIRYNGCSIYDRQVAGPAWDIATYREDSFDNMKAFAQKHRFTFPYVIDETQEVARAYGAQCTRDFFGFNAQDELQYRTAGRVAHKALSKYAPRLVRGDETNR